MAYQSSRKGKEKCTNEWSSVGAEMACMYGQIWLSDTADTTHLSEETPFNEEGMTSFGTYGGGNHTTSNTGTQSYSFPPTSTDCLPFSPLDVNDIFPLRDSNSATSSGGEIMAFEQFDSHFGSPLHFADMNSSDARSTDPCQQDDSVCMKVTVPRLIEAPFEEKILEGLSLFKQISRDKILAQVWLPIKEGDNLRLSTYKQPYLMDQTLGGYREVSRSFTFATEAKTGSFLGLPGRVYMSKIPEWTSNAAYYNQTEYLRVHHAVEHKVRGLVALPVFSADSTSCRAVLELVTLKEKANYNLEMENICRALEEVDLRSTHCVRFIPQLLSNSQMAALKDIHDLLRAVCHAHELPLALTWIPCVYNERGIYNINRVRIKGSDTRLRGKSIFCVKDTACYVKNIETEGFIDACSERYLEEGQGIVGKIMQNNQPVFYYDMKTYDISEYPLVHHARKFGLTAALAIHLRSKHTGNDDYVGEFFFPPKLTEIKEQKLLLEKLFNTIQRMCRSSKKASMVELHEQGGPIFGFLEDSFGDTPIPKVVSRGSCLEQTVSPDQAILGSIHLQKQRNTRYKRIITLDVLKQYFTISLKDAAKHLGVSATTLKKYCRELGISRWPCRKINKVKRSMTKIRNMLEYDVEVESELKINPTTRCPAATGNTISQPKTCHSSQDASLLASTYCLNRTTSNANWIDGLCLGNSQAESSNTWNGVCCEDSNQSELNGLPFKPVDPNIMINCSKNDFLRSYFSNEDDTCYGLNSVDVNVENFDSCFMPQSLGSLVVLDEMHNPMNKGMNVNVGQGLNQATTSTSRRSESLKITAKAIYGGETVRFSFDPCDGFFQLYLQVGNMFNLQSGTFYLKYLDDEKDWVLLRNDSDLIECMEMLDTLYVKFQVCNTGNTSDRGETNTL